MRFVSTRIHGVADYGLGIVLMASPWLFGFATGGPAQWVPIVVGAGVLVMAVFTLNETGLFRVLPMDFHLGVDFWAGALLVVSPWLFNFADVVFLPHLVLGLVEIGTSLTTRKTSSVQHGDPYAGRER
jgi:hypothetical protein